jgi:hypothetical protein
MLRHRFAVWLGLLSCTALVLMTPVSGSERSRFAPRVSKASRVIVVSTAQQLIAAFALGPQEQTIVIQPGTYQFNTSLEVPDNIRLVGGGQMQYDDSALPTGFAPEGRTVLAATSAVTGDFVRLGNGSSLQGLVIQDAVRPALTGGSPVVVSSRSPGDFVSAQVTECEIINPNPVTGPGLNGPVGRGLLAITRNRAGAGGTAPHEQSLVSVHLTHSVIRSPGGGDGIFAINFASGSHIELHLFRNVIGKLGANGGVSSPDSTVGATVLVQSTGNLYRADTATPTSLGWQINGASDPPVNVPGIAEETLNNKLSMHSVDDRIEGFARAIGARGAQRQNALSGAIASNELELILNGTRLSSTTTDFGLFGAGNLAGRVDDCELRVTMHNVIGSGQRANTYGDMTGTLGIGNRLNITGNLNAFSRTNDAISPMPGENFFTAGR